MTDSEVLACRFQHIFDLHLSQLRFTITLRHC
nr:MAG TPA: hypothetical protein [Caudoviricetes sp.]